MRRLHLLEIEDQPWCPRSVRDGATDYLRFVIAKSRPYSAIADRLRAAIVRVGASRIVDLGSGGAGPWPGLLDELYGGEGRLSVVLTDLYPNVEAFEHVARASGGRVAYRSDPIDALVVPADLVGFRTSFSGFHHFRPEQARRLLRDAVDRGQPIGVFEATQRRPVAVLLMLLTPLIVLLVTPFLRPFRWSRLMLTYLLPLIPLVVVFDGIVSCLRTYTVAELEEMARSVEGAGYEWQAGEEPIPGSPIRATYLIGLPAGAVNGVANGR